MSKSSTKAIGTKKVSSKKPPKAEKPKVSPIGSITVSGKNYDIVDIIPSSGRVKTTAFTVEEICKRLENGAICRDTLLQRMEDQWNNPKKSQLILSALYDRPLGTIIMTGKGMTESKLYEKQSLLDGLQRTTTFLQFTRDKFKLVKGLPPVMCSFKSEDGEVITEAINVSGLKFSELPTMFQRRILETKIDVNIYNGFTDKELDNIVFCVNNGVPFKPMQKLRTVIGSSLMQYIQPICDLTFWEKTNLTAKNDSILGCVIRTLMLYIMLYVGCDFKSLSTSEMTAFANNYLDDCEEYINAIKDVENLFIQFDNVIHRNITDEDYSFLTPCAIPHFIMNFDKFQRMEDVKITDYTAFLNDFLKSKDSVSGIFTPYTSFVYLCHSGSGGSMYSLEMVDERQCTLDDDLDGYIDNIKFSRNNANG